MAHLIHIGNSLGVRIPFPFIKQMGLTQETELALKVTEEGLLISPIQHKRAGWDEAFKIAEKSKERLLLGDKMVNEFDQSEWEW